MVGCVGSKRYRPFEGWHHSDSKHKVHREEGKSCSKRAFDMMGNLLHSENLEAGNAETGNAHERIGSCYKCEARGEDPMLCSTIQLSFSKKMAVNGGRILPSGIATVSRSHSLRSTEGRSRRVHQEGTSESSSLEVGCKLSGTGSCVQNCMYSKCFVEWTLRTLFEISRLESRVDGSLCFAAQMDNVNFLNCRADGGLCFAVQMNDANFLNQTFCTMEEQFWAAQKGPASFEGKLHSFLQLLWTSFIPYSFSRFSTVSMAMTSSKDAVQRFMHGDAFDFEDKQEEADKEKEASDRMNDGKNAKEDNTRTTKKSKDEDKGEGGKENKEDEAKETGEKRGKEGGEGGGKDGKDDEKNKKEGEEEMTEEEEEEEEEGKEEDDTEVNSAVCTLSIPPVEQIYDCGPLSECRSQQSDDMYHGQEGISFQQFSIFNCPMSDGSASHCMQHESPCLQSIPVDASGQASSDMSRDMYSDGLHCSIQRTVSYGSPCLHPVMDAVGWQTPSDVSRDMYTDGSVSHNWQQTTQASPPLHPVAADTVQQTSSGASRDCASPNQAAQPERFKLKIKLPKEELTNAEPASTVEDGSGEEVLSKLNEVKGFPSTAKGLLSSGLLDGCRVHYLYKGSGSMLTGTIKDGGILCDCKVCKGKVVVNVSSFEKHAGSNARHPSDYIFLENGKSLQEIIKAGSQPSQVKVTGVARKAANEESGDRSSLRSGSARGVSTHHKKGTFPGSESSKPDAISSRSSQRLQMSQTLVSQTRDGSRHKLLFQPGGLLDGTEVAYYVKGQKFLTGTKMGYGICCGCCNEVISCSQFEAHAGWASRRNAYISMYLPNGQSLHEFALTLVVKDQNMTQSYSSKDNNDFCAECGDGGDLVLCDACPKAYHAECIGLTNLPEGDWCCPLCEDQRQHPWKKNTRESGRVHSLFNKEKSAQRCQRVVKSSGNAIGGCVFCMNGDFLKSGFGPKTIMLCDQCEREYHVGCMKEKGVADLQELPAGEWFCCGDCNHIHSVLEGLVRSGPEPLQGQEAVAGLPNLESGEITWQLLHGRRGNPQNGRTLSEAASIFTESFDPIVDAASGRDLISLMVYSRSTRDQDFQGMYCAVLKQKEEVTSAAVFRVFGRQFAEMPLVATASASRGQGYFQMLMSCIEGLLRKLQVKYFILPAAEGAEGIWTNKFGFSKLHEGQLQQFGSEVQMMIFQGSSMLIKDIL